MPDALAHGDAERGVKRAAAGDQDGSVLERVADRQGRQLAVVRGKNLDTAQDRGMQRAHAHGRLQPRGEPVERQRRIVRQSDRHRGIGVAIDAGDDWHDRARGGCQPAGRRRG